MVSTTEMQQKQGLLLFEKRRNGLNGLARASKVNNITTAREPGGSGSRRTRCTHVVQ